MSPLADDLWRRAIDAWRAAKAVLPVSPDSAASRAYYAAFYAVSAVFALEGRAFTRHAAVETAVHRDLVKTGRWSATLGRAYSQLLSARSIGDYGGNQHVSPDEADHAVRLAQDILRAASQASPEVFPVPEDPNKV